MEGPLTVGLGPLDSLSALLKTLQVGASAAVWEEIVKLFAELREYYEAQEPTSASEYAGYQDDDVKQNCKFASLLFIARVWYAERRKDTQLHPASLGYPISRIVEAAGINLLDFFREVNVVVSRLSAYFEAHGSSLKHFNQQAQLKENSEMVVVMALLAKKYKDNFNLFLHQLDMYKQVALRLGWSAFLVLRVKLLSPFPDVVSCMELLPCIFAVLASHAPRLPDCLQHVSPEDRVALLLKTISELCKADFSRVQARMASVQAVLTQIFTTAVPEWRSAIAKAKAEGSNTSGAEALGTTTIDLLAHPVLKGLVTDPARMDSVAAALEREYEEHYTRGGSELDERDFLCTDFTKFASPRASPGHMQSAYSKMQAGSMLLRPGAMLGPGAHTTAPLHSLSPLGGPLYVRTGMPPGLHSPLPIMRLGTSVGQPVTPVSEAMGAAAWLRGLAATLTAEPSAVLQRFLAAVPVSTTGQSATVAQSNLAQQLNRRVRDMVAAVIPEEKVPSQLGPFPLLQPSLASERRAEAIKLYYHSLESILVSEEKVSGLAGATALLSSTKFHRGLIACCVEVVAACYRMVVCAFPKVLDALRIKAFDLAKMIQNFVKSMTSLPRELKRHLFLIEEKILEALAWEPGSSLYHLILTVHQEGEGGAPEAPTAAIKHSCLQATLSGAVSADAASTGVTGSKAARSSSPSDAVAVNTDDGACNNADANPTRGSSSQQSESSARMDTESGPAGLLQAQTGTEGAAAAPETPFAAQLCGGGYGAPPLSPKRSQASTFSGLMSPAKKARGADGHAHATLTFTEPLPSAIGYLPPAALQPGSSAAALYDFCRKVLKLSAFRLALLCENFDFSPLDRVEVNNKVYETIEHAVYRQTHLFYNRHIDQIMLSALYGYCKVHKLQQVSFREIIAHYRKQPQSQQSVFRSVVIEQSDPGLQITCRADIISFYNQVFVPAMKTFLLKGDAPAPPCPGASNVEAKGRSIMPSVTEASATRTLGVSGIAGTSCSAPGLPPLPPTKAGQSPRRAKVLALPSVHAPAHPLVRSPSTAARDPPLEPLISKDEPGGPCKGPGEGPLLMETEASLLSLASVNGGSGKAEGAQTAGTRYPSASGSQQAGSGGKGSGPRARSTVSAEHKIPECLAVLLQALDSQQQGASSDGEEKQDAREPTSSSALSGPVIRTGRAGVLSISSGRGSKDRRASRHTDHREDRMETDMVGEDAGEPSTPAGFLMGRRNRTPNRRYGAD